MSVRSANQPPVVSMTSPNQGAHFRVGSTISLAATATDSDGIVTAVEYRSGGITGAPIGRATAAPYTVPWTGLAAGNYTVVAVAFDDRNASTASDAVHISVDANASPSVSLTSPYAGSSYVAPAMVSLAASATDSDGSITRVDFLADGTLVASATAAPYLATWNAAAAGNYALTARATDNAGAVGTSTPVSVTITANAAPSVTITLPAGGSQYFAPATIVMGADAADADGGIARVDFYANGMFKGTSTVAPYRFVWDGVAPGTYSITASAVDTGGFSTSSQAVSVTVSGAPDLSFAPGLDGATVADDNVLVQGYVSAPGNSALTVNGVVTHIDDFGRFQANDVPLVPGANPVTVALTTQDGQTASRSIIVNSTGRGPLVVHAAPTEGLNSLDVTFTVENPASATFKQIAFDLDGDGAPNVIATPDQFANGMLTVTATYPAGTWLAIVKAYDDQDQVIYSTRKSIVVLSPASLDARLRAIYDGMLNRLKSGNVSGALTAFTGSAYDKYSAILSRLQPTLPSIVDQLGELREVTFSADLAEMSVVRNTPSGPLRFLLYLIRAEDGIWRIDGM